MDQEVNSKSWWQTVPGIVTAITGMITAVTGLLVALYQIGAFNEDLSPPPRGSITDERALQQLGAEELKSKQKELERKLAELQEKIRTSPPENPPMEGPQIWYSIAGNWHGVEGSSYVVYQSGNTVTMEEVNPLFGITAVGQGTISGQDVDVSYVTGLGTVGRARLQVSGDGRQLTGEYTDLTTGVRMPLVLYR